MSVRIRAAFSDDRMLAKWSDFPQTIGNNRRKYYEKSSRYAWNTDDYSNCSTIKVEVSRERDDFKRKQRTYFFFQAVCDSYHSIIIGTLWQCTMTVKLQFGPEDMKLNIDKKM